MGFKSSITAGQLGNGSFGSKIGNMVKTMTNQNGALAGIGTGTAGSETGSTPSITGSSAASPLNGLAAQSASSSGSMSMPTMDVSGVVNPAADASTFGNRTNGSGLINNQMMQGFNGGLAAMSSGFNNQQQGPSQYNIVGGAQLI